MRSAGAWAGVFVVCFACSPDTSGGEAAALDSGAGGGSPGRDAGGAASPSTGGAGTANGDAASGGAENGGTASGGAAGSGAGGDPVIQVDAGTLHIASKKLDLLFMIDNSISMADKQVILKGAISDLTSRLTAPSFGVEDLHVGVITSSLGGHGATSCAGSDSSGSIVDQEADDHAHLVGTRPRGASLGLPSGFVAWRSGADTAALVKGVEGLVGAAGEFGCGFEASLESVYRFLVDPSPPKSIVTGPCGAGTSTQCAFPTGTDDVLLAQRKAFLRPDSAVAVVVLSDENDCSIREGAQYYYAARSDVFLPRAAAVCATNPNDPCCHSCAAPTPSGCTADPTCQTSTNPSGDALNLRCFEQKRRFGLDFLYPVERYVNALSKPKLCTSRADLDASGACPDTNADGSPDLVESPLFAPATDAGRARDASMVRFLGIVGVPWQTLRMKNDAKGAPLPASSLVYPKGIELVPVWPVVYGDPSASPPVPPEDPLMIESIAPRTGTTPGTGEPLASPTAGYLANSVNGHEYTNSNRDDLQYACVFALATPRDCAAIEGLPSPQPGCDCATESAADHVPLCQAPDGTYDRIQRFAKAYPGIRHLALAKGLGSAGSIASICARNLTDPTQPDYGYRTAVDTLLDDVASIPVVR